MYFRVAAIFTGLVVLSQGVMAQTTGMALAQANNCVSCHRVNPTEGRKRLGPDFEVVAKRYNGSAAAVPYLATKISSGSRASWGAVPMPAQSHVSSLDAEQLAAWVLSLAGNPESGAVPAAAPGRSEAVPGQPEPAATSGPP